MSKLPKVIIILIALSSCNDQAKHKEEITASIKQLNQAIGVHTYAINDREAKIKNISQFNESIKVKYKYDSLVKIQELNIQEVEKLKKEKDSLQNELNKLK